MKKYKVNIDRQKPSSEEISAGRNFDELMKQYKAAPGNVVSKPFWKSAWFIGSLATTVIVVSGIFIYQGQAQDQNQNKLIPVVQTPVAPSSDSDFTRTGVQAISGSFIPTKRKVAPPLTGLNVRNFVYKFKTAIGGTFTHNSGTKVTFPANAFVDANGKPVSGNIEIQYREFRDQVDFFISGIPMQYDSAQQTYQFESAGMMEITGSLDGKPVYLAKGKTINVEFASKEKDTKFSVYRFDTLAGNWNYLGKDKVVLTPAQKFDSASLVAQALKGPGHPCAHISAMQKPVEPLKPLKADRHKNRFTIAINALEFPEMRSYKDMIFEVDESNQKFNSAWYNVTWESIKLSKTAYENKYQITLAKSGEVVVLDVYPVFDDKNFEKEMSAYNLNLIAYQKELDKYNQQLEQRKAQTMGVYDNGKGSVIRMNTDGSFTYFDKPTPEGLEKSEEVKRCFTISGFGIYNLDAKRPAPVNTIVLTTKDRDGKKFEGFTVFSHVDRKIYALFGYGYANPVPEFAFDPKSSNLAWAVKDGKLFYADNDQFIKLPVSGSGSIQLKPVNKEFKTPGEMRTFFKIGPGV
ncbi:hypothetical protein BH11BAC7_BH11BAC7_20290 [soil metagenome]